MKTTTRADDIVILTDALLPARERLRAAPRPRFGWQHVAGAVFGAALGFGFAMALDAWTGAAPPAPPATRGAVQPGPDQLLREARKAAIEHRFIDAERLIGEAEAKGEAAPPAVDDAKRFLDIVRSRIDFG
jgi:hypothetical protein